MAYPSCSFHTIVFPGDPKENSLLLWVPVIHPHCSALSGLLKRVLNMCLFLVYHIPWSANTNTGRVRVVRSFLNKQTKKPMKASDFHLMDTVRATCVAAFPNGHKNVNVTRLPRAACVCGRLFLLTVFFLLIRFSFPLRRKMNRTFSLTSLLLPRLSTSRCEVAW